MTRAVINAPRQIHHLGVVEIGGGPAGAWTRIVGSCPPSLVSHLLLLALDQLLDVHKGALAGGRNCRGNNRVVLEDTIVDRLPQCLGGREQPQRWVVDLLAKVHVHQREEGPFAPLGFLGHLNRLHAPSQGCERCAGNGQRFCKENCCISGCG